MKLIVGLGNPGKKYDGTRHNVGFDAIAAIAKRYVNERPKSKFNAEVVETIIKNEKAVLMCPLTFMNLSGQSVRAAVDFYKLSLDDILIICDDLNLPTARLRLRSSGSAGGQNGLADIIQRLGSKDFCRMRIGIDRPPPKWDTANYVLGKFDEPQAVAIQNVMARAVEAVETWIESGIQKAMSQFNPDPEEVRKRAEKRLEAQRKRAEAQKKKQEESENSESPEPNTNIENQ